MIWGLVNLVFGLLVVAALVAGLLWVSGRRLPLAPARGPVRVLGHVYLGGRRGLSLVRLGSSVLVLGVTDHQVNLVATVAEPELVDALEHAAAQPLVDPERWQAARERFGDLLEAYRRRGRKGDGGR